MTEYLHIRFLPVCHICLGEKKIKYEEFLPLYEQAKEDKDNGVYEDFVELFKLYDKAENGLVLVGDIHHALLNLGISLGIHKYLTCLHD